jgi:hypothetical protein
MAETGVSVVTSDAPSVGEFAGDAAAQVTRFATKPRDHNQQLGFMITRTGLSGRGSTHARGAIRTELSHGHTIVVLTLDDVS